MSTLQVSEGYTLTFYLKFFLSFFLYVHINFACSILFKRTEGDLKYLDQEIAGKNVL